MWRFINGGGWVLILVAVLTAWTWREINAASYRAEVTVRAELTEQAVEAFMDSVDGAWAVRESVWDSTHAALASELEDQRGAARAAHESTAQVVLAARARVRVLLDSMETLTAADLEVIGAGIDSLEASERLCNDALGTCEELVEAANARIWDVEAQLEQSVALNERQGVTITEIQAVRPPMLGVAGWIGWAVAAGLAVVLVVP